MKFDDKAYSTVIISIIEGIVKTSLDIISAAFNFEVLTGHLPLKNGIYLLLSSLSYNEVQRKFAMSRVVQTARIKGIAKLNEFVASSINITAEYESLV